MSELKDIVPTLGLCKQIPAGAFEDSVLVWRERIGNISRDDRVKVREPEDISYKVESAEVNYFPAPTLAEIFKVLPATIDTPTDEFPVLSLMPLTDDDGKDMFWIGYNNTNNKEDDNPATAALRLWLKVKGNGDVR